MIVFQSTHPVRGATAPPKVNYEDQIVFQSTHPVRGATRAALHSVRSQAFQSTHPVRGATKWRDKHMYNGIISIHAPREGCDRL